MTNSEQQFKVGSWQDLCKCLHELEADRVWACRGEPQCYESVLPLIDRVCDKWKDNLKGRLLVESLLLQRFNEQAPTVIPPQEREFLDHSLGSAMIA